MNNSDLLLISLAMILAAPAAAWLVSFSRFHSRGDQWQNILWRAWTCREQGNLPSELGGKLAAYPIPGRGSGIGTALVAALVSFCHMAVIGFVDGVVVALSILLWWDPPFSNWNLGFVIVAGMIYWYGLIGLIISLARFLKAGSPTTWEEWISTFTLPTWQSDYSFMYYILGFIDFFRICAITSPNPGGLNFSQFWVVLLACPIFSILWMVLAIYNQPDEYDGLLPIHTFWWHGRPTIFEVVAAFRWAEKKTGDSVFTKVLSVVQKEQRQTESTPTLIRTLSNNAGVNSLSQTYTLAVIGSEAANALAAAQTYAAANLLQDIAQDTTARLKAGRSVLLCSHCLARVEAVSYKISRFKSVKVYGCRRCRQSRTFIECPRLVLVLDNCPPGEPGEWKDATLYQGWDPSRPIYDFDAIEVRSPAPETVEGLVMMLGNDRLHIRRRAARLPCRILNAGSLPANTRAMLDAKFKVVNSFDF